MAEPAFGAMMSAEWIFEDEIVADSEVLLRRIPKVPGHATLNAGTGRWTLHAGAFQRSAFEGMSVHRVLVVEEKGRAPECLYDSSRYISLGFRAGVPRSLEAGVVQTIPSENEEPDEVLREAHAEVRPREGPKDRTLWSLIIHEIQQAGWLVQS